MPSPPPTSLPPAEAAKVLREALKNPQAPLTVADAAAQSGLALRDAERGLQFLTSEYRGHLRVTNDGDLLYLFPTGFTQPWKTRDAFSRALGAIVRAVAGAGRFVVRAWISVVLVAYVAVFLAVVIGLLFARRSDEGSSRRSSGGGGALVGAVLRGLAEAFFWTFHPFSPLAIGYSPGWGASDWGPARARHERPRDTASFYDKVNRFFFGPPAPAEDPRAVERRLVAQIRAQKGRIGTADVMRVTGLSRADADPLMARLMLDYDGSVEVSDAGGVTYAFPALRLTAQPDGGAPAAPPPAPALQRPQPLTGNQAGTNALIVGLNGFNLVMAVVALVGHLTVGNVVQLFQGVPFPDLKNTGTPIALGVVPLLFSLMLFALPLGRALVRPLKTAKLARENGRKGILREVLRRVEKRAPLEEAALQAAWRNAAGREPREGELTRVVVDLGGEADITPEGQVRYRFGDLEAEAAALDEERAAAPESEARPGPVVFASDR